MTTEQQQTELTAEAIGERISKVKINGKSGDAARELMRHEVSNRGHAFVILKEAGLSGSGAVFNAAVKEYERVVRDGELLGKSAARRRDDESMSLRAQAFQMSADAVRKHIDDIDEPDQLFWACWKVFRHEGKWSKQLKTKHFAVHFSG